ncbi:hypothetical protein VTI74DRAFT_9363 [Chaetomium olivicolor]
MRLRVRGCRECPCHQREAVLNKAICKVLGRERWKGCYARWARLRIRSRWTSRGTAPGQREAGMNGCWLSLRSVDFEKLPLKPLLAGQTERGRRVRKRRRGHAVARLSQSRRQQQRACTDGLRGEGKGSGCDRPSLRGPTRGRASFLMCADINLGAGLNFGGGRRQLSGHEPLLGIGRSASSAFLRACDTCLQRRQVREIDIAAVRNIQQRNALGDVC